LLSLLKFVPQTGLFIPLTCVSSQNTLFTPRSD
jgi:hypothetical protein